MMNLKNFITAEKNNEYKRTIIVVGGYYTEYDNWAQKRMLHFEVKCSKILLYYLRLHFGYLPKNFKASLKEGKYTLKYKIEKRNIAQLEKFIDKISTSVANCNRLYMSPSAEDRLSGNFDRKKKKRQEKECKALNKIINKRKYGRKFIRVNYTLKKYTENDAQLPIVQNSLTKEGARKTY